MTLGPSLPAPLDVAARAVVHHPDQRSPWLVVAAATLPTSPDGAGLADTVPLVGARLRGAMWVAATANPVVHVEGDPLDAPDLWLPLRLEAEAPLRIVAAGRRVALAGHHAAFDGRSLLTLLHVLAGADHPPTRPGPVGGRTGPGRGAGAVLGRLLHPADRVAPSAPAATDEARVWRTVELGGGSVTARVAAAATTAVAAHNRARRARWRRVGISVALGGPPGVGNRATYRRVDVDLQRGDDVGAAVTAAIAGAAPAPVELRRAPRALRLLTPLVDRLGDSLLVSNLGRVDAEALDDVVFFPVARGRSAVAFGAVGTTLSLRARDLSRSDAEALLDATVAAWR